jgi:PAS domain S-box-containing protein
MLNAIDFHNANILIVDDLEANIALLQQLLSADGYRRVSSTTNPRLVGELHSREQFDLILLDLQMPAMDGFEVMQELKNKFLDDYLPVIVLTAQPGHKLQALQAGAKDFISKPFDLLEVKTRIHNMLEVRLLYKQLAQFNDLLERTVLERTAQLRASEERYRRLTELASDWYWEQDENGQFTKVSGPVLEMLGIQVANSPDTELTGASGWDERERSLLRLSIAAREPFLDFLFHRVNADGSVQQFRVSGEPAFNSLGRFLGYRGIGVEVPVLA